MTEDAREAIIQFSVLAFCFTVIGYLIYYHTGAGKDQINPVYWAGAVLPVLIQVSRKAFDLIRKDT